MSNNTTKYDERHGGAYDRGMADSYYRRPRCPHYYEGNTGSSRRFGRAVMTAEQLEAYHAGYTANEEAGDHKY